MIEIDEAFVDGAAPNAGAIKNGRALVLKRKLVKLLRSETGDLIWSNQEGSQYQDDYGVSVVATRDGSYLVAGFGPGFPMMKFDDAGIVAWVRNAVSWQSWIIYGGFSLLGLPDGTFSVPGWVYVHRVGDDFDAVLARIDSEGRIAE